MSDIQVDGQAVDSLMNDVLVKVDDVDSAIGAVADCPDGGIATEYIGLVMAASIEAAATMADSFRALLAIAGDVLDEFAGQEAAAAEEIAGLTAQLEDAS